MFYDITTVAKKELKEILIQRGSLRAGLTNMLIYVGITGILFPMQWGREWISSPVGLVTVSWLPLFASMGLVADAFAGERERHTLETLLASRLSEPAILFGKMSASVLYGLGIAVAGMLVGALTVNLINPGAGFYPLPNLIGALAFGLLGMILVNSIGILVSMGASNVRSAYQRMSIGFIVLWLPLILGPQLLPAEWKAALAQALPRINGLQAALGLTVFLLALDLILLKTALARFQRTRLVLS